MNTQNFYLPASSHDYKISGFDNLFTRFMAWCNAQEPTRLAWTGIILLLYGCVITPITLFFVIVSGVNPVLLSLASCTIMVNLVVNLAALPTRITIPVFAVSLIVNAAVIFAAFSAGVNLSKVF
jgi:hypothetical protein